jgi:competence protein ComEC
MTVRFVLALVASLAATSPVSGQAMADPEAPKPVAITFLDVGQGDATVIRTPSGRVVMIDAGRVSPLRQLTRLGVSEIALLIATHAHADHIGGLDDVLTARPVDTYVDNGTPHTTETYRELMAHVERLDVRYLQAVPRTLTLDEISLDILPLPPSMEGQNNRSVGVLLRYGDFLAFFSGDSERPELEFWQARGVVEDVTLLKAPHHGAVNGFTHSFLEEASPEVVVISVGATNPYGHPRPEALAAYSSVADEVLRTDRDGTVTVLGFSDGRYETVLGEDSYDQVELQSMGYWDINQLSPGDDSGGQLDLVSGMLPSNQTTSSMEDILTLTVHAGTSSQDAPNLNAEYVVIENHSPTSVDIGMWRLCDLSSRCFRFPSGSNIDGGRRVVVYTGYGTTDGVSFFMNNGNAVWNDNGDEARLFGAGGQEVLRYVYE